MAFKRVENSQDLIRDERTGAIIDANVSKLRSAKAAKAKALRKEQEQENMKSDIATLKDEMSEIKSVLKTIVEKL